MLRFGWWCVGGLCALGVMACDVAVPVGEIPAPPTSAPLQVPPPPAAPPPPAQPPAAPVDTQAPGAPTVEALFAAGRSDVWVTVQGVVDKRLPPDLEGSRHQRFIVKTNSGHTVLVAHNIDLADEVPLKRGDRVIVRGEYEHNARGGVVHWTHHDPGGRRVGGYIEHRGERYR